MLTVWETLFKISRSFVPKTSDPVRSPKWPLFGDFNKKLCMAMAMIPKKLWFFEASKYGVEITNDNFPGELRITQGEFRFTTEKLPPGSLLHGLSVYPHLAFDSSFRNREMMATGCNWYLSWFIFCAISDKQKDDLKCFGCFNFLEKRW